MAVSCSVPDVSAVDQLGARAHAELAAFRHTVYHAMTARRDGLFEVTDAVLCSAGPVNTFVELSLAREHRRSHGGSYDTINCGAIDIDKVRRRDRARCVAGRSPKRTSGRPRTGGSVVRRRRATAPLLRWSRATIIAEPVHDTPALLITRPLA